MPANDDETHKLWQACLDFNQPEYPAVYARGGVALLELSMSARSSAIAGRASLALAEGRGDIALGEGLLEEFTELTIPVFRRAELR